MSAETDHSAKDIISLLEKGEVPYAETNSLNTDLMTKSPNRRLDFGFEFRGVPFVVRAEAHDDANYIELRARFGVLPYTAEDPGRRATALAIVNAARLELGSQVRVDREQRIVMIEKHKFNGPLTPTLLLTFAAEMALRSKPYLELLTVVAPPPVRADAA